MNENEQQLNGEYIFDTEDNKVLNTISDYGRAIALGGNAASLIPSPWTKVGGTAVAILGDTSANLADIFNGKVGVLGGLGRTVGDIGLDLASIFVPGAKATKIGGKTGKLVNNIRKSRSVSNFNKMNGWKRAGIGTGAVLGTEYIAPGMNPEGTTFRSPFTGVWDLMSNIYSEFDDPNTTNKLFKTISIPIFLAATAKGKPSVAKAVSSAASGTGAATAATGGTTAGTAAGTTGAAATGAGTATAGTTGAATATGAAAGGAGTAATGGAAAAPIIIGGLVNSNTASAKSKKSNKKQQKPKTVTGTYTGKPSDDLLSGIIIGRRNGGKLDKLINLRK